MLEKFKRLHGKFLNGPRADTIIHSAKSAFVTWQNTVRSVSKLMPIKQEQHTPLLTAAQPFGHELDRFRTESQSLVAWNDKQTQQWRIQGFLHTPKGRPLGFQLSFFDWRLHKDFLGPIPAAWIRPQLLAAHFVIIDPIEADLSKTYDFSQKGGLLTSPKRRSLNAGENFHLELDGWYAYQSADSTFHIYAQGLHIDLKPLKTLVLHGQNGYAQRGEKADNAAYHCSYPRLEAKGRFLHGGRLTEVAGAAWIDHEKLTMPGNLTPSDSSARHDHYAIQLDTGQELMISQHRYHQLESSKQFTVATWIDAEGQCKHLIHSDIAIETKEHWVSPQTGTRYPLKKTITIEALNLRLELRPMIPAQEAEARRTTLTNYWSGLHYVTGNLNGVEIKGHGFLRFEGYDSWIGSRVAGFLTQV